MIKIVIIDNYDSFTYNLSHLVKELGADVTVYRNDQFKLPELEAFDKGLTLGAAALQVKAEYRTASARHQLLCQRMIGVRGQPWIRYRGDHRMRFQELRDLERVRDMPLHAHRQRLDSLKNLKCVHGTEAGAEVA